MGPRGLRGGNAPMLVGRMLHLEGEIQARQIEQAKVSSAL